jgi:hypothetical protein
MRGKSHASPGGCSGAGTARRSITPGRPLGIFVTGLASRPLISFDRNEAPSAPIRPVRRPVDGGAGPA